MRRWLLVGAAAVLILVVAYSFWRGHATSRLGAAYDALVGETVTEMADIDKKDETIRALAVRIKELSDQAGAARRRADEAEAKATVRGQEAARLGALVAALQAEAAARAPVDTRRKALDALKGLGYRVD